MTDKLLPALLLAAAFGALLWAAHTGLDRQARADCARGVEMACR